MSNYFVKTEYCQSLGMTKEANTICVNYSNAMNHFIGTSILITRRMETQEFKRFLNLKEKWISETMYVSSGSLIISNSAYRDIISMGSMAIPWIIRDLKKTNSHWFYALEKITGENPIKTENIGVVEEMKNDWVSWASKKHYL